MVLDAQDRTLLPLRRGMAREGNQGGDGERRRDGLRGGHSLFAAGPRLPYVKHPRGAECVHRTAPAPTLSEFGQQVGEGRKGNGDITHLGLTAFDAHTVAPCAGVCWSTPKGKDAFYADRSLVDVDDDNNNPFDET